ncbi:NAD(P) transhydrogenase subunit alpha part 1 [Candidatus Endolissoclinum faulkneri L5]|uniref:proton-translocating NAD(P)(+) transhydrogenase n=1 Tax=Candidatus Endolissoclinum faulkneri L5 TaxID=1401328 RepID=V9TW86_9PROT|nr:Re/Si-specific NAD(P)(+) transhydrogenase subunit alpha [Candidatus Endolissoclinum faulkneri]AHC73590.1 NAD(P) transhydrogenase subunit alpha part 1 [Candidatus Endolissoclinum faulkneri L5]
MKIGIVRERRDGEKRVAVSTETVCKYIKLGANVVIEFGAGLSAGISNEAYTTAGANIVNTAREAIADADIVLKVRKPTFEEIPFFKHGALLISLMEPYKDKAIISAIAKQGIRAFALELIPRITRAQSMDVLSSQSNLVGYKSVLDAAALFGRSFPMMITAAGTMPPARVFVIGAGVAGLQAIATARRLGAVVSAMDVRPDTKEQIESLGGTFLSVKDMDYTQTKTASGYANEMSDEYKNRQSALIEKTIVNQDVVITTALILGKSAPLLITEDMIKSMKPGSVIVDIAVEQGGNCQLSKIGATVKAYGITIVGYNDAPSRIAVDASALYARNLLHFMTLIINKDSHNININENDEIIKASSIINNGMITNKLALCISE